MKKVRTNEKKYHGELVDILNDELGGWGFKAQRGFVGGMPDVELKAPHLALCKVEVKHEVYTKMPQTVKVAMTELQRMRLRHMQRANLSCGWAVFITVARDTWLVYGSDPDAQSFEVRLNSQGRYYAIQPTNDHQMGLIEWTKDRKISAVSGLLNLLTRRQAYLQKEASSTETSPTTPGSLKV